MTQAKSLYWTEVAKFTTLFRRAVISKKISVLIPESKTRMSSDAEHLKSTVAHVYIHVPFCSGKCSYCAFYSEPYSTDRMTPYITALDKELQMFIKQYGLLAPDTLYIGGGTPSVVPTEALADFMSMIHTHIRMDALTEYTMEANPGTLPDPAIALLKNSGVNRISLGAQSFNENILTAMGRRHTVADISATVERLREHRLTNIGLDLIAAFPGVNAAIWQDSLQQVLAIRPPHLSVYACSIEPGTKLAQQQLAGAVSSATEAAILQQLDSAHEHFVTSGYSPYETSNYALEGHACLHNMAYWQGKDYVGFGPAAATRLGQLRQHNAEDLTAYCAALEKGTSPPGESEMVSVETDAAERFVFAFRTVHGCTLPKEGDVPDALRRHWQHTLSELQSRGLVCEQDGRWRLTPRSRHLADAVARELLP